MMEPKKEETRQEAHDAAKLRTLAVWFDMKDAGMEGAALQKGGNEVQLDLHRIADRLESFQTENERLRKEVEVALNVVKEQEQEIQRLREALERIDKMIIGGCVTRQIKQVVKKALHPES